MSRRYTAIHQLDGGYAHIYLSPHLDDAALSCGGAIARFVAAGQPVLVVNLCDGSPPPGGPLSPFAAFQHARWGLPPDEVVARRRAEDAAALAILGADSLGLGLLDAIYRLPAAYSDDATLFGAVDPADTLAADAGPSLRALAARFPDAVVYAPLAVGGHVDHRATQRLGLELLDAGVTVAFYEDFPYAAAPGALEAQLAELGAARYAPAAVEIAAQLERKTAAIGAYASQLATIFAAHGPMPEVVADYARSVAPAGAAYGERVWIKV